MSSPRRRADASANAPHPPTITARAVARAANRSELRDRVDRRDEQGAAGVHLTERAVEAQAVAVGRMEGTFHQHEQRHPEEECHDQEVGAEERSCTGGAGPLCGLGGRPQPERDAPTTLDPTGDDEQPDDRHQLHDGQRGGEREVQELRGLPVDLGLQGGVARAAEDQDHAEGGEREQEHDRARRRERGPERGQGDLAERPPPAGAEHACGFLLARVEMGPEPADGAHHDRVVEEHVSDQDRPHGLVEPETGRGVLPDRAGRRRPTPRPRSGARTARSPGHVRRVDRGTRHGPARTRRGARPRP